MDVKPLPNGDFMVAEFGGRVVRVMRPTGFSTATQVFLYDTVAGVQGDSLFMYIDVDTNNGNIYVSDSNRGVIRFTPGVNNGIVFISAPVFPIGLDVVADTHLYITLSGSVRRYSLSCSAPCTVPESTISGFSNPFALAVSEVDGSMFVTEQGAGRIVKTDAAGNRIAEYTTTPAPTGGDGPYSSVGVDIDSFGNLITSDVNGNRLVIWANAAAVAVGDPQFFGFHGQSYQVHGYPEEWFSIVSSPSLQVNAKFKYIDSGSCTYNNTACWTHPGTYMSSFGIVFGHGSHGVNHISLVSGSHSEGMLAFINGNPVPLGSHIHLSRSSEALLYMNETESHPPIPSAWSKSSAADLSMALQFSFKDAFHLSTSMFSFKFVNSDSFFNLESTLSHAIVKAGQKHVDYRKIKQGYTTNIYPDIPIHGFIGQTWRNAVYESGRLYEGEVDDYVVGEQFGTVCALCTFHNQNNDN